MIVKYTLFVTCVHPVLFSAPVQPASRVKAGLYGCRYALHIWLLLRDIWFPVCIIGEDVAPVDSAHDDMMERVGYVKAWLAWHGGKVALVEKDGTN